jgi:hypothetical protein
MRAGMNDQTIIDRADDLLSKRFDLEPGYAAWVAQQLDDADLLGADVPPELQLARLLVTLMAIRRPADAVLACKTFDALPSRWALNVRQHSSANTISTEGDIHDASDLASLLLSVSDATPETAEQFVQAFGISFTSAVATLIDLATRPETCPSGAMPTAIAVGRNLVAPIAEIGHFPTAAGTFMALGYSLRKPPSFPFGIEGLAVTARVDGAILFDLAQILEPTLPPAKQARPMQPAA